MPNSEFTGLLSTDLTNKWLSFYSSLFKMTLILKYFLYLKQFNNTYNGKSFKLNKKLKNFFYWEI